MPKVNRMIGAGGESLVHLAQGVEGAADLIAGLEQALKRSRVDKMRIAINN